MECCTRGKFIPTICKKSNRGWLFGANASQYYNVLMIVDELKDYCEQAVLLDGLLEFHPNVFESLLDTERSLLYEYYQLDCPEAVDIHVYHRKIVVENPGIDEAAQVVFRKICDAVGIVNL